MGVSEEIIGMILRFGKSHNKLGDPFECSLFVDPQGDTAFLKGATGSVSSFDRKYVFSLLSDYGFKYAAWVRLKGEIEKPVKINLNRYSKT